MIDGEGIVLVWNLCDTLKLCQELQVPQNSYRVCVKPIKQDILAASLAPVSTPFKEKIIFGGRKIISAPRQNILVNLHERISPVRNIIIEMVEEYKAGVEVCCIGQSLPDSFLPGMSVIRIYIKNS